MVREKGSPFNCENCTERQKEERNCFNRLGLSEDVRAVERYTDEVKAEIKEKGAKKVFPLGNIRFYECPLSYLLSEDTQEIARIVSLVDATGALLYSGGLGDQPYWFIEAYQIFKEEQARDIKKGK